MPNRRGKTFAFLLVFLYCGVGISATATGGNSAPDGWQQLKDQMKPLGEELRKTCLLCGDLLTKETSKARHNSTKQMERYWGLMKNGTSTLIGVTNHQISKLNEALKRRSSNYARSDVGVDPASVETLENLEAEVAALRTEVAHLKKIHLFFVAIQNAEYSSFRYYDVEFEERGASKVYNSAAAPKDSSTLVRKILFAFQQGHSAILSLGSVDPIRNQASGSEELKASIVGFYYKVRDQIHKLTGVRPKLEWMDDGRCKFSFPEQ